MRRAKGEGSVYKDKQGNWNGQILLGYTEEGKARYKKFKSHKQAVVIQRMNEYKLANGTATEVIVASTSFETLLSLYTKTKELSIRKTSFDSLCVTARQICQHIGHYNVQDITSEILQTELINAMTSEGYAYGTISKAFILTKECLNYALGKDYITKNPCGMVKLPTKENFPQKPQRFLSADEIQLFKETATSMLRTIDEPRYVHGNIICLILYTGLRVGELCGIKWRDVDFDGKRISVNSTIVVEYRDGRRTLTDNPTTKSGKPRFVPLNKNALSILTRQQELVGGDSDCYIINGSTSIPDKTLVAKSYTAIAKHAGIEQPNGIHTLRHTFASNCIIKGIDIKVVSEILGHSSVSITYNIYVHIIDAQKQNAVDMLDDL